MTEIEKNKYRDELLKRGKTPDQIKKLILLKELTEKYYKKRENNYGERIRNSERIFREDD